jgi:hypothetical protein
LGYALRTQSGQREFVSKIAEERKMAKKNKKQQEFDWFDHAYKDTSDYKEEMAMNKRLQEKRRKKEKAWFKAHNKTIQESREDFREARKIIYAKRERLPREIIEYHELKKNTKENAFFYMDLNMGCLAGSFDWPPEKVIRDKFLEIHCFNIGASLNWRGPYFEEDIDWRLWLDNYENGVPDEENIYKIKPLKILVPDSEMNAELDRIIKTIDEESAEDGEVITNLSGATVEQVLEDFEDNRESVEEFSENGILFGEDGPDY